MAFITIDGENKIALQQGNSQLLNISHFVLANIAGLGAEPVDRIEAMPDAGDIVDTRAVTKSGYVNTNQVVYSLTLDSSIGDYTFNWVGLKDEDDVLIAVIYLDDPITKTATDGGIEGNNLVRNFLLQYSGIQATTAINAPAETWQIDFTLRLLQIDERERLSNFDIYGHEAFFTGGFDVTLNAGTVFDVSAGVGYVGGIRCELMATQAFDVGALPNSIWVDASLQGDLTGKDAVVELVASNATLTDYTDGNGVEHYLAKICDITGGSAVTDTKVTTNLVDDHESKADPHTQYLKKSNVVGKAEAETGTATTPRAWTAQRVRQSFDSATTGAVIGFAMNSPPSGWIKANGAEVSRSTYSALFSRIGATFGAGDGSTTFNLPDMRGEFVRGFDDSRGVDTGRPFGSAQTDQFESHYHLGGLAEQESQTFFGAEEVGLGNKDNVSNGSLNVSTSNKSSIVGGSETRPRNIALLYCIKY